MDEQDGTGDEDDGGELLCKDGPPAVAAAAPPPLQLAEDDAALEEQPGLLLTIKGTGIAGACSTRMGSSELSVHQKYKQVMKYLKRRTHKQIIKNVVNCSIYLPGFELAGKDLVLKAVLLKGLLLDLRDLLEVTEALGIVINYILKL